jgi:Rhodococcus equi virulence-associated protein
VRKLIRYFLGEISMTAETPVSKEILAHDFMVAAHGKMEPEQITATMSAIANHSGKFSATGNVISAIFYLEFRVFVSGGKNFFGRGGGLSFPGAGQLLGDVYTDDLDRLYRDTVSFQFNATPVYLSILFFDNQTNLLGHYQAGAVSIVTGIGGGTGSWS